MSTSVCVRVRMCVWVVGGGTKSLTTRTLWVCWGMYHQLSLFHSLCLSFSSLATLAMYICWLCSHIFHPSIQPSNSDVPKTVSSSQLCLHEYHNQDWRRRADLAESDLLWECLHFLPRMWTDLSLWLNTVKMAQSISHIALHSYKLVPFQYWML